MTNANSSRTMVHSRSTIGTRGRIVGQFSNGGTRRTRGTRPISHLTPASSRVGPLRVIAMQRGMRTGGRDAEEGSCRDRIVIYCARGSVAKYRCKRYWCVGKLDLRSLTEAVNKRPAQSVCAWTYVYTYLRHDIKWWVNRGNRSIVDSETIANAPTIVTLKFL